jgi:hypothetical protein
LILTWLISTFFLLQSVEWWQNYDPDPQTQFNAISPLDTSKDVLPIRHNRCGHRWMVGCSESTVWKSNAYFTVLVWTLLTFCILSVRITVYRSGHRHLFFFTWIVGAVAASQSMRCQSAKLIAPSLVGSFPAGLARHADVQRRVQLRVTPTMPTLSSSTTKTNFYILCIIMHLYKCRRLDQGLSFPAQNKQPNKPTRIPALAFLLCSAASYYIYKPGRMIRSQISQQTPTILAQLHSWRNEKENMLVAKQTTEWRVQNKIAVVYGSEEQDKTPGTLHGLLLAVFQRRGTKDSVNHIRAQPAE